LSRNHPLVGCLLIVSSCFAGGCGGSSSSSSATNTNPVTMSPANGTTLPNGQVGNTYSETFVVAGGGVAPYVLEPVGTPAGLTWTSTSTSGTLSGTPTQAGGAAFEVTVTDSTGAQTNLSYPLAIIASGGPLTLPSSSLPSGAINVSYTATITVTGGTAPYTFTTTGTLPPGLTLAEPGGTQGEAQISGTPTAAGTFDFTVTVTDSTSPTHQSASTGYSITIS